MGAYFELCATLLRLRLAALAPQAAQVSMRCGPTLLRTMRDKQGCVDSATGKLVLFPSSRTVLLTCCGLDALKRGSTADLLPPLVPLAARRVGPRGQQAGGGRRQ